MDGAKKSSAKKLICYILCAVAVVEVIAGIILVVSFIFLTRTDPKFEPTYVEGDFVYDIWELDDGERVARIVDLSDEGKTKEVIILPETLGVYRVYQFSYRYLLGYRGKIESDNLKRLYCPYEIYIEWHALIDCFDTLERVVMFKGGNDRGSCGVYSPYVSNSTTYVANTLYYYNYIEDEKADCYWVDDYDYGAKITFIPPNPQREGYVFDGWYKEKECLNKWDFDVDTLPTALTYGKWKEENPEDNTFYYLDDDNIMYQQTRLYAKWIKN